MIHSVRALRKAQVDYLAANTRYGSLYELVGVGLIDSDLTDGNTFRHTFELTSGETGYKLLVYPDEFEGGIGDAEYSLYMDDSGLIRMSFKPGVIASESSEPIANQ